MSKTILLAGLSSLIIFISNPIYATDMRGKVSECRNCWMDERVACKEIIDECRPIHCDRKSDNYDWKVCEKNCVKPNQACQQAAKAEYKRCQSHAGVLHDQDVDFEGNWAHIGQCYPPAP